MLPSLDCIHLTGYLGGHALDGGCGCSEEGSPLGRRVLPPGGVLCRGEGGALRIVCLLVIPHVDRETYPVLPVPPYSVGGGAEGDREAEEPVGGPGSAGRREMWAGAAGLPLFHGCRKAKCQSVSFGNAGNNKERVTLPLLLVR